MTPSLVKLPRLKGEPSREQRSAPNSGWLCNHCYSFGIPVCSDGTTVTNPKALASGIKQLRRLDKAIARSRNVHGRNDHSNRRERLYTRRRNLHARIVNVRNDNHHKATTAIAKSAGRVVVETLNVVWDVTEPQAFTGHCRCRDVGLPDQAGVQVPVVRRRVREGGPLVCIIEAVLPLRLEEP